MAHPWWEIENVACCPNHNKVPDSLPLHLCPPRAPAPQQGLIAAHVLGRFQLVWFSMAASDARAAFTPFLAHPAIPFERLINVCSLRLGPSVRQCRTRKNCAIVWIHLENLLWSHIIMWKLTWLGIVLSCSAPTSMCQEGGRHPWSWWNSPREMLHDFCMASLHNDATMSLLLHDNFCCHSFQKDFERVQTKTFVIGKSNFQG